MTVLRGSKRASLLSRLGRMLIRSRCFARRKRSIDSQSAGPLHGVPVGVKDVIETHDMPTEMGSPIYRGYRTKSDASCVALLRAAGALILGKTVTCEFAGVTAGPTTNPHDPSRTPGGSSSGSGAAVADFMVPLAFGTQTGGSFSGHPRFAASSATSRHSA